MPKRKLTTTNPTLLRLHGTPFKNAATLKSYEEKILMEEWQNVERARVRRELLMKDENRIVLTPLLKGLSAKFVNPAQNSDHMIRVFLTEGDSIQVDIDEALKSKDNNGVIDSLVRSLVGGLVGSYFTALGLLSEAPIPIKNVELKAATPKSKKIR